MESRRSANVSLEERGQVVAAELRGKGFDAAFRHADAGFAIALPLCAHHVVQCRLAAAPQRQVQRQGDQGTFDVIADNGVGACSRPDGMT